MIFQDAAREVIDKAHDNAVKMYLAGEWIVGNLYSGAMSRVVNPATEELLACVGGASSTWIRWAFEAAHKSQEYWHFEVGEQEKERVFRRVAYYLDESRGPLSWVIIQEGGKLWRWAEAEVQETIDTVWHYHGELSRISGKTSRCQMSDKRSLTLREPYGVILGITPWNFPLAVPSWKIFAALAGGNAIVVKAAEQTPTTLSLLCYFVHRAIEEELGKERARKLRGLFQVAHGKGETVGKMMLEEGQYDKAMFTGGTETGSVIGEIAGRRRKPVSLELGGHAAIILMDDFDLERAVSEAVNANCGDSGQRCVSLREVFVEESAYGRFVDAYVKRIKTLAIGNPADPRIFLGPLVSKEQLERVEEAVGRAIQEGAKAIAGGARLKGYKVLAPQYPNISAEAWERGYFFAPTVLTDLEPSNYARNNEIFGTVLCVTPFSGNNKEEAILRAVGLVNSSRYGLSNAVMTNRIDLAMKAMERIKTGIFYIGRGTTGAEVGKPFGGVKDSGHGREGCGIEEVTYEKQVYIDYHGKPRMAQAGADEMVLKLLDQSKTLGYSIFA